MPSSDAHNNPNQLFGVLFFNINTKGTADI